MIRGVYRGTCAWCFRTFRSTRVGIEQRHGWVEVSGMQLGGRQVGVYDQVSHAGECSGCSFPPYELSRAGTEARLAHEQRRLEQCDSTARYLASNPPLVVEGSYRVDWHSKIVASYEVRLVLGDDFDVEHGVVHHPRRHFSYARQLLARIDENARLRAHVLDCIALCERMIAGWKLAELPVFEARRAVVHYRLGEDLRSRILCGTRSRDVASSEDRTKVTCTRCLRVLAGVDEAKAASAALRERSDRVHAWLLEHGPASAAAIKAALGLDQRQLNGVLQDYRRFDTVYDGSKSCRFGARV